MAHSDEAIESLSKAAFKVFQENAVEEAISYEWERYPQYWRTAWMAAVRFILTVDDSAKEAARESTEEAFRRIAREEAERAVKEFADALTHS